MPRLPHPDPLAGMAADELRHAIAVLEQSMQLPDSGAIWQSSTIPLPGPADGEETGVM